MSWTAMARERKTTRLSLVLLALLLVGWRVGLAADAPPKKTKEELVVANVYLGVDRLPAGGTCPVAIVLEVKEGWHINANPPSPDYMKATKIKLKTKLGSEIDGEVQYPKGTPFRMKGVDEAVSVYEGKVVLRGRLKVPAAAAGKSEELDVTVEYQACNNNECLTPSKVLLKGVLDVAAQGEAVKPINEKLFPPAGSK